MFKQTNGQQKMKKKPPPRPPPPNLEKIKSKFSWNLNFYDNNQLIEFSPPNSPKRTTGEHQNFGGSVSSSFSSSSSSLASSKKSFEYEIAPFNVNSWTNNSQSTFYVGHESGQTNVPSSQMSVPTIIRAQPTKKHKSSNRNLSPVESLPMPSIPPPSPPKDYTDIATPYGIALYDFPATHNGDLNLQVGDVVVLLKQVSDDWLYGRVDNREGIFPTNFIDIKVPLFDNDDIAVALYDFHPQMAGDLELKTGQPVQVIKKISEFWLYGESNGKQGQFPANFINRVPGGDV